MDAGADSVGLQHLFGLVVPAWDVQLPPTTILSVLIDDNSRLIVVPPLASHSVDGGRNAVGVVDYVALMLT